MIISILVLSALLAFSGYKTLEAFSPKPAAAVVTPVTRKFKVGDCVARNFDLQEVREVWDKRPIEVSKVTEIGKAHYRILVDYYDIALVESELSFILEDDSTKVKCTSKLERK